MDNDKVKARAIARYLQGKDRQPTTFDAFSSGASSLFSDENDELANRTQAGHPEAYALGKLALPLSLPASALKEAYKRAVLPKQDLPPEEEAKRQALDRMLGSK